MILEEALEWAANGVPVFPCNSNKRPMTSNGHKDASCDPVKVRFMFENLDDSSYIGGRMGEESGIFALDFDLYKGQAPQDFMDSLIGQGLLPETRRHRTKSGGLHLLYKHDSSWPNLVPCEGVEIKGEGGYIILPPSLGYSVEREGLATAPDGLIAVLMSAKKVIASNSVDAYKMRIIQAEEFHDSIRQVVAKRAAINWPVEQIMAELQECLAASVARADPHPRHDRWLHLMMDEDKELTRLVMGGMEKFSPDAASHAAREVAYEHQKEWGAAAAAAGFLSPPPFRGQEEKVVTKAQVYDPSVWPFSASEGYFASEKHDLLDQNYVMHPFFAEEETTVLFAEPKMGKTAWNLTACFYIACGLDFGTSLKVTEPRACIYYALEGTRAIKLRIEALRRQLEEDGVELPDIIPLFIVERPQNFLKEEARNAACNQIIAADKHLRSLPNGKGLGVVSIDTLTKAMSGGDQNSVEDTSALFELSSLLRVGGVTASIVFVHHKARTGGVRGSTNIEAEPDVLLDVSKDGADIVVKVARARSIEEGGRYVFGTKNFDLGVTKQNITLNSFTVFAKDGDTVTDVDVGGVEQSAKIMKVIVALGDGMHELIEAYKALQTLNLEPKASAASKKRKYPLMANKAVQSFFDEHISDKGRVFAGHAVSLVRSNTSEIVAVNVREL